MPFGTTARWRIKSTESSSRESVNRGSSPSIRVCAPTPPSNRRMVSNCHVAVNHKRRCDILSFLTDAHGHCGRSGSPLRNPHRVLSVLRRAFCHDDRRVHIGGCSVEVARLSLGRRVALSLPRGPLGGILRMTGGIDCSSPETPDLGVRRRNHHPRSPVYLVTPNRVGTE